MPLRRRRRHRSRTSPIPGVLRSPYASSLRNATNSCIVPSIRLHAAGLPIAPLNWPWHSWISASIASILSRGDRDSGHRSMNARNIGYAPPPCNCLPWYVLWYAPHVVSQPHGQTMGSSFFHAFQSGSRAEHVAPAARAHSPPGVRARRRADAQAPRVHRVAHFVDQILVDDALRVERVEPPDHLRLHPPRPPDLIRSCHLAPPKKTNRPLARLRQEDPCRRQANGQPRSPSSHSSLRIFHCLARRQPRARTRGTSSPVEAPRFYALRRSLLKPALLKPAASASTSHDRQWLPQEGLHMELKNTVAIVTGGARGIGRGIAYELAKEGVRVALADLPSVSADRDETIAEVQAPRQRRDRHRRRRARLRAVPGDGAGRHRQVGPGRYPRQQRRRHQGRPRLHVRRGGLGPHPRRQREGHVPLLEGRRRPHDAAPQPAASSTSRRRPGRAARPARRATARRSGP